MKKTLQRLGIVTMGLSLCLWSCKEQDGLLKPEDATSNIKVAPKIKENIDFSVVEGRLKFETMDDFKGALAKNINQQAIKKWEMNPGFTSTHEAYEEFYSHNVEGVRGTKLTIDKEYDDVVINKKDKQGKDNYKITIPYPALSCLTNKDGVIQIGDQVIKITDEESRIADVKYVNELEKNVLSNHISIHKINQHLKPQSVKNGKVLDDWSETTHHDYSLGGGFAARRFEITKKFVDIFLGWNGSFDEPKYNFIYFSGLNVEHQRDNWYGWGSIWIEGWSWGSGYANLTKSPVYTDVYDIYPFSPFNWNSSGGIVNQNTESIFLGSFGFFESSSVGGTQGFKLELKSNDVKGYTPGQQDLNDIDFTIAFF